MEVSMIRSKVMRAAMGLFFVVLASAVIGIGGSSFANANSSGAPAATERQDEGSVTRMAQRLNAGDPFKPSTITSCAPRQCVNGRAARCSRQTVVRDGKVVSARCVCRRTATRC
jgi:hypothetical protein